PRGARLFLTELSTLDRVRGSLRARRRRRRGPHLQGKRGAGRDAMAVEGTPRPNLARAEGYQPAGPSRAITVAPSGWGMQVVLCRRSNGGGAAADFLQPGHPYFIRPAGLSG